MIALASDYILCRVRVHNHIVIQKIRLSDYDRIMSGLPKRTFISVLSYNVAHNHVYGWADLHGVEKVDRTTTYLTRTGLYGTFYEMPYTAKIMRFVTLLEDFFPLGKNYTFEERALSAFLLPNGENMKIEHRYHVDRGWRKSNIKKLLTSTRNPIEIRLKINDHIYNPEDFTFNEEKFLKDMEYPTFDWYYTLMLLEYGYFVPDMLNSRMDIKGQELRVPREVYWMFQLKYGRDNDVYFSTDTPGYEHVNLTKLKPNINNKVVERELVDIKVTSIAMPIFIQKNTAIRYVGKRF